MIKQFFDVAIIGAGPGGMSAAARAAQRGMSHVLLESSAKHANTIQQYQKSKHVMSEPSLLPLRSDLEFEAGARESILDNWEKILNQIEINIRYQSKVISIEGHKGSFQIVLKSGDSLNTKNIILALGVQGNARKLNIPGEEHSFVQNTLGSADSYHQETIVIIGAGDSAIENAITLSRNNYVVLVNRRNDFSRAKLGNMQRILKAIDTKQIECFYDTTPEKFEQLDGKLAGFPGRVILKAVDGIIPINCHRVITRLGTIPPRKFVESIGVRFVSEEIDALPELSSQLESNVPGVYIIGSLAGYPLIKQAMNQGYEVIEHVLGKPVKPSDQPVLEEKLKNLPFGEDVDDALTLIKQRIRLLNDINRLNLRELVIASSVIFLKAGEEIYTRGSYSSQFYNLLQGNVQVETEFGNVSILAQGQFFGESSLISGRPRQTTVIAGKNCILLETPQHAIKKLMRVETSVRYAINRVSILRSLSSFLIPDTPMDVIRDIANQTAIHRFTKGEFIFREADSSKHLYLIRSGSVTLSKKTGDGNVVVAYCAVGSFIGLIGLSKNNVRMVSAQATIATETLSIDYDSFNRLLASSPMLDERIREETQYRLAQLPRMQAEPERGETLSLLMDHGLGQATNVLIIDESLCVGCDNCETACAATHHDISRLDRKAGPSFYSLHIPAACRHCEHPMCMQDCPPDAIHRLKSGEVYINDDTCIGCGKCEENCPYDVIQMAEVNHKPSLMDKLLGKKPQAAPKTAVKCDMCMDLKSGPACVNACPTGAAIRIHAEQLVSLVSEKDSL